MASETANGDGVLRLSAINLDALIGLLQSYRLGLVLLPDGSIIPGSYWGAPEAGVIGHQVFARLDTPVHSMLHEACHLIVAGEQRRSDIHTDATDCTLEEDATCYLQIVLAERLADVGGSRVMRDMDAWGYSFRLGSTRAWFEQDAADARATLIARGLLPNQRG